MPDPFRGTPRSLQTECLGWNAAMTFKLTGAGLNSETTEQLGSSAHISGSTNVARLRPARLRRVLCPSDMNGVMGLMKQTAALRRRKTTIHARSEQIIRRYRWGGSETAAVH